jgi:hypothetical protein
MGWLRATIDVALQRPDIGAELRAHLRTIETGS